MNNTAGAAGFVVKLETWGQTGRFRPLQVFLQLYFLNRFSNACRASSGRAGDGASVGVCVGCI